MYLIWPGLGWPWLTGGRCSEVAVNSGLTVFDICTTWNIRSFSEIKKYIFCILSFKKIECYLYNFFKQSTYNHDSNLEERWRWGRARGRERETRKKIGRKRGRERTRETERGERGRNRQKGERDRTRERGERDKRETEGGERERETDREGRERERAGERVRERDKETFVEKKEE
jgi:hypothetical protein